MIHGRSGIVAEEKCDNKENKEILARKISTVKFGVYKATAQVIA